MSAILLDTHAAMWSAAHALADETQTIIDEAAGRGELLLSPITAWEIGMLFAKGRIRLAVPLEEYIRRLFVESDITLALLTPKIAMDSTMLPGTFHQDPADRMIVATAAAYGAILMTRDKAIHTYAKRTKRIQCIAC